MIQPPATPEERSIRRSTLESSDHPEMRSQEDCGTQTGLNLRIKDSRGSRSQIPVSKPPEARRKPEGICRSTHLDVSTQGYPETEIARIFWSHIRVFGHPGGEGGS